MRGLVRKTGLIYPNDRFRAEDRSDLGGIVDVFDMNTKRPLSRSLLLIILAGLVLASAGMASAGRLGFLRASAQKSTVRLDTTTCAPEDEGTPDDEGSSEDETTSPGEETPGEEGNPEECEEPDEGDETTEPGEGDEATQPGDPADREAECKEAAGMSTLTEGEGGAADGTEGEVKKGLDHAIEVVLANCIKNPQAPGLVNALRHLVANRDRHLAHKAELAARRAARDAAKAARQSARGGHGKGA
jgi:hypothetical protein